MTSVISQVKLVEGDQEDHNSVNSWESDQTLTPSEEDLHFNKKFVNYQNKSQNGCQDSSWLGDNCSSAASEALQGYKGSDDGREEEDDDARTFVGFARKSSSNVSIELEVETEPAKPNNQTQVISLQEERTFKETRLFSINRSLSVASLSQDSLDQFSQIVKLPEIRFGGHEASQIEGIAVWGQLDSLLPAAGSSDTMRTVNQLLFSCTDPGNGDLDLRPKFFARINASFYSSDDDSSSFSKEFPEYMIDDMVEGLLEEIYDEFFVIQNPFFLPRANQAAGPRAITWKEDAISEPQTSAVPTAVEPTIETVRVLHYDSDTEEEVFEGVAEEEPKEEETVEKVPDNNSISCVQEEGREMSKASTSAPMVTSPERSADDEVLFCKKHQEYVGVSEFFNKNNGVCSLTHNEEEHDHERESNDKVSVKNEKRTQSCEDDLSNFINLTIYMMNMNDFVDLDCSFVKSQTYVVDYNKFVSLDLLMTVSDNFSKIKSFMAKNSDMRTQIMSGFFLVDGAILDPTKENMMFHMMNFKPQSKIVLVRQLASSEQLQAPELRYSC